MKGNFSKIILSATGTGLYMNDKKTHISELKSIPGPGWPVSVDDHCYTCTAGAGFT